MGRVTPSEYFTNPKGLKLPRSPISEIPRLKKTFPCYRRRGKYYGANIAFPNPFELPLNAKKHIFPFIKTRAC